MLRGGGSEKCYKLQKLFYRSCQVYWVEQCHHCDVITFPPNGRPIIPHISHKRCKRRLWKIFSSITCEGNFLTINAKSTKVLKSSCVILRGKIPWPKMRVWKKMTNMRYDFNIHFTTNMQKGISKEVCYFRSKNLIPPGIRNYSK